MDASFDRGVPRGRGLLRGAGRATLWAAVGLVLARGVGDIVADAPRKAVAPSAARKVESFPDGEARAVAVEFARSYLSVGLRSAGEMLSSLVPESLRDQVTARVAPGGPGAVVADAVVAREVSLGESRALITIAAFMRDGRTRYLTVPVGRDEDGGLSVYDLPAFAAPPAAGEWAPLLVSELSGAEGDAQRDLAERFLRAYLAGDGRAALAYFLAPGTRLAPMGAGLRVEEVQEVARLGPAGPRSAVIAATVLVREQASGARYRQRYRLGVRRAERWQITSIAGGPRS